MIKKEFVPLIILGVFALIITAFGYFELKISTAPQEVKIQQTSTTTTSSLP